MSCWIFTLALTLISLNKEPALTLFPKSNHLPETMFACMATDLAVLRRGWGKQKDEQIAQSVNANLFIWFNQSYGPFHFLNK